MDPIALAGEADGGSSGTVGDGIAKSGRSNETGQTGRGEFQSAVLSRRLAGDKPTLLLYHPIQPSSSLNLRRIPGRDCFQPVLFKISISSRLLTVAASMRRPSRVKKIVYEGQRGFRGLAP